VAEARRGRCYIPYCGKLVSNVFQPRTYNYYEDVCLQQLFLAAVGLEISEKLLSEQRSIMGAMGEGKWSWCLDIF